MRLCSLLSLSAMSYESPEPRPAPEDWAKPRFWPARVWGYHRVSYAEWGDVDSPRAIICAHGFTRNGRDFDFLAERLSAGARVVCPDMPGRGRSDWLSGPPEDKGYNYSQYMLDATALIARLGVPEVDWVGTSMGALLGMMLAAQPGSPIRRLVMNDAGPFIPKSVPARLAAYVGLDKDFRTSEEVEAYLRTIYAGFGDLTEQQWHHIARHSERRKPDGKLGLAFDPNISLALKPPFQDVVLWSLWDAVRCPVLVLRGENSEVLLPEVAEEMTRRGPKASVRVIPGCGHAPTLMSPEQITLVETWLETGEIAESPAV
jgi:pimeloyl-ACP methyl ester carboxylesterase